MKDILNYLPILKAGTSKENYPLYAQLLHIEDGYVSTCNDAVFVKMKLGMPFDGNVNIFVFENALKMLPDEYNLVKEPNSIVITTKKLQYDLKLVPMTFFPSMEEPDVKYMEVDEGILSVLKTASSFTGLDKYEHVFFDDKGMLSTSGQKILRYAGKSSLDKPVILPKSVISLLKVGYFIGSDENDNTIVKFPNGFAIFTTPHYSSFPGEKIREFIDPLLEDTKKLVNVGVFKDALSKVTPIFFGETLRIVELKNDSFGILKIRGESPFNGVASASVKSELSESVLMYINVDLINVVPGEYDFHIKSGINDRLMAKNHSSEIVLIGV